MFNYYNAWCKMKYWRLHDILDHLAMYGALSDGYEKPDDYLISATSYRNKYEAFIEKSIRENEFPAEVKWIPMTEANKNDFDYDSEWNQIGKIDYFATTVNKEDIINWAIAKKIGTISNTKVALCNGTNTAF